jgi:hypothetical protein
MRLKDMGNIHPHGARFVDIQVYVPLRINDSAEIFSGQDIRTVSDFFDKKMYEQHGLNSLIYT